MTDHKKEAQDWLVILRRGSQQYDVIRHVRDHAREGNFSLADIGTSEDELDDLRVKSLKMAAQSWLVILRRYDTDKYNAIKYIRDFVREGNFSLADIGTSEEEFALFANKKNT